MILVTGGAGFIGSFVVEQLCDLGHEVRVLDRLHPGAHDGVPDRPRSAGGMALGRLLRRRRGRPGASTASTRCATRRRWSGSGVDLGDAPGYVRDNDLGTAVLLAALHERGFAGRLVLASSMVVYGEGRYRCADARRRPAGAADPRRPRRRRVGADVSRLWRRARTRGDRRVRRRRIRGTCTPPRSCTRSTSARRTAASTTSTVVALRYHNVYGPRMPRDTPYAGVASIFRSALEAGRAPTVFEDGGQLRDFVHVTDVARANVAALTLDDLRPGRLQRRVRASGTPSSRWPGRSPPGTRAVGREPVVVPRYRLGDVRHVFGATAAARRELGFVAEMPFAPGHAGVRHRPAASSARGVVEGRAPLTTLRTHVIVRIS